MTNNYFPKKQQNKISTIKTKTNNTIKSNKNKFNLDLNKTFSSTITYSNYKAKQESEKEKKLYEEKIKIVQNRIEALKKQQSYLSKKAQKEKENEKNKNIIKKEKESIKQALLSVEIDNRNEMEIKRNKITQKKLQEKEEMVISRGKIINDKLKEYKKAYFEKKQLKKMIIEDNNKSTIIKKILIDKIKSEREKNKKNLLNKKKNNFEKINNSYRLAYQTNLNETKKLKNELIRLEKVEEKYLENMKYSEDNFRKNKFEGSSNDRRKHEKIKSFDCLDRKANQKININNRKYSFHQNMSKDTNTSMTFYYPVCKEEGCNGTLKIAKNSDNLTINYVCDKNALHRNKNIKYNDFSNEYLKKQNCEKIEKCKEHDEVISRYCNDCKRFICKKCLGNCKSKNHPITLLDKYKVNQKQLNYLIL